MLPNKLNRGDLIGVIAPSRPFSNYQSDFDNGIKYLKNLGYKIELSQNIHERFYYSAGTAKQRVDDLNSMFANKEIKAIICAIGGISSNQLLPYLNYDLIKKNPKIFIGYSDITTLLLAIYNKTGLITYHGPDVCDISNQNTQAIDNLLNIISQKQTTYPKEMTVIKEGRGKGKLIGGNILISNALLGTEYSPEYNNAIWFWEAVNEPPAKLDFLLNQFKLSGNLDKISGMVIGYLSECTDKKYPQDNRPIEEIILDLTKEYDFPIIKANYFGHDIKNFYTFPIGIEATLDTNLKQLQILEFKSE